jgi:hypothetical protein
MVRHPNFVSDAESEFISLSLEDQCVIFPLF